MKKRKARAVRHRRKSGDSSAAVRSVTVKEKLVWKAAQERKPRNSASEGHAEAAGTSKDVAARTPASYCKPESE